MNRLLQDVRFGLRTLLKRPGFTLVAVLTLALGVGANTAIFSVVNAVLLRPLPFKDADRLVSVYETTQNNPRDYISVPNLEDYRAQTRSFEALTTFVPQSVNLTGAGEPDRVRVGIVPALQLSKTDVTGALKEGGSQVGEGAGRSRLRGAFVVAQVALSLVLLVGAGLLLNSFYRLLRVSPGFRPENLLTMEYRMPRNKYPKGEQQWEFHRLVAERAARVPGVESATVVRALPFSGNGGSVVYALPGQTPAPKGQEPE